MRLGELLDLPVVDVNGQGLGSVRDVRLVADGPVQPPGDHPAYRVHGLVVGSKRSMARLGYAYGDVHGPWVLAVLLRAAARRLRYLPWDAVVRVEERRVVVEARPLRHPADVR